MGFNPQDTELWEGPEVEGRLYGVWTLFVGDIGTINSLDKVKDLTKYRHIYFNQGAVFSPDGTFDATAQERIVELWQEGWYFTISINDPALIDKLPGIISDCCHITIVFQMPEFNHMAATHSLKVQGADGWCWMVPKGAMLSTHPFAYRRDRRVE